jgi:hypothetical protein
VAKSRWDDFKPIGDKRPKGGLFTMILALALSLVAGAVILPFLVIVFMPDIISEPEGLWALRMFCGVGVMAGALYFLKFWFGRD